MKAHGGKHTRGGWLNQGARVLMFRRPQRRGLQARPGLAALLALAGYGVAFGVQRALTRPARRLT
ncbi:MAG: hypothetical protein EOP39_07400 [Rubrivivax sp.]|nr:MAG: hypothetical protein EOP39_07400 [Rubrivivax sp.]